MKRAPRVQGQKSSLLQSLQQRPQNTSNVCPAPCCCTTFWQNASNMGTQSLIKTPKKLGQCLMETLGTTGTTGIQIAYYQQNYRQVLFEAGNSRNLQLFCPSIFHFHFKHFRLKDIFDFFWI